MFEIMEGERHSQIVWKDRVINFAYDPNRYTAQAEAEWQRIASSEWSGDMACAFVERLLISWDLMGDVEFEYLEPTPDELERDPSLQPRPIFGTGCVVQADHPFPIELIKLRYIPIELLGDIIDRIQKDVETGKAKRLDSNGGSNMGANRRIRRVT